VLRSATKVATADPDWAWYVAESQGGSLVFFNQASVPSMTMARIMAGISTAYRSPKRAARVKRSWWRGNIPWTTVMDRDEVNAKAAQWETDFPIQFAAVQEAVAHHIALRDCTDSVERDLLIAKEGRGLCVAERTTLAA
jgi:hypothetical protein